MLVSVINDLDLLYTSFLIIPIILACKLHPSHILYMLLFCQWIVHSFSQFLLYECFLKTAWHFCHLILSFIFVLRSATDFCKSDFFRMIKSLVASSTTFFFYLFTFTYKFYLVVLPYLRKTLTSLKTRDWLCCLLSLMCLEKFHNHLKGKEYELNWSLLWRFSSFLQISRSLLFPQTLLLNRQREKSG